MDKTERLVACDLIKKRFAGRAELRRQAERDSVALAELEYRLGLAPESAIEEARDADDDRKARAALREMVGRTRVSGWLPAAVEDAREALGYLLAPSAAERRAMAVRRYAQGIGSNVARAAAPAACWAVDAIRAKRAERNHADPLAKRRPGYARREIAERRAAEVIDAAGFREATHGHDTAIRVVAEGAEGASADSVTDWPNRLGVTLPNAYKYRVTQSSHVWSVSTAILRPEVRALNAAAPRGVVYLSTTVRVRQGRGTSLTVEHLSPRQALRALREAA